MLVIDPSNQQVLYGGGAFKGVPDVYCSLDRGASWGGLPPDHPWPAPWISTRAEGSRSGV